jgi:hypothetical protein
MPLINGLRRKILSAIEHIAKDERLFLEKNFILRSRALDDIEFHVIDRIRFLTGSIDSIDQLNDLKDDAEKLRNQLEEVNTQMYCKLRSEIARGKYKGKMMSLMNEYLRQPMDSILQP